MKSENIFHFKIYIHFRDNFCNQSREKFKSCQPVKMKTAFLLVIIFLYSNALCVEKDVGELFCIDESYFEGVFTEISKLTLDGGFIAPFQLKSKFPELKVIEILSSDFMNEQCLLLSKTKLKVIGCSFGK